MKPAGANLSEERFFPRPLSKDFILSFFCNGIKIPEVNSDFRFIFAFIDCNTIAEKTMRKVLGMEFDEEPFFKRVSLNMPHKITIRTSQ